MEALLRVSSFTNEVEYLKLDDEGIIYDKTISFNDFVKEISKLSKSKKIVNYMEIDDGLLYENMEENRTTVFYKLEEQRIKCTYKDVGYSINHPNTIFKLVYRDNVCTGINAYCYKEFLNGKTQLYTYPFPNMYTSNSMCLGTINPSLDYKTAIFDAIEGNYTHDYCNLNGFDSTKNLFEYLSNNSFPYDRLSALKYDLNSILED